MVKAKMDNVIGEVVKVALQKWKQGTREPWEDFVPPCIEEALHNQETLGWQAFLEGCISTKWHANQHQYYLWLGFQKNRA